MKTIALFGGSGKTGQQFLKKALAQGYTVRALARTPSKISQRSPQLTVVPGDVLDPRPVAETVQNADVVVSLFGHVKGSPDDLQTRGTAHIVAAMQRHGVSKIISLSGGGLPFERDEPKFTDKMIRTIMNLFVPKILRDAESHAEVLRSSGLDWMVVRGPRLNDKPETGTYRVGWVGVNASTTISRADLADFIVKQIESNKYIGQMPFVTD